MITTFLLEEDEIDPNINTQILDINPDGFTKKGDFFNGLKSAVDWALLHDEDVIYCVCGNNFRYNFNIERLNEIINELANEEIYSLFVDVDYENFIAINSELITVSEISSISSFFLFKPIYKFVHSILEKRVKYPEMTRLELTKIIVPNSFLLHEDSTRIERQNKIHIISPFRNVEPYLQDYLDSILKQEFVNFDVTLIDDFSTDSSKEKIPDLSFIRKIVNMERKCALQNILDTLTDNENFDDEDIICLLDGDDKLANKYILNIINQAYQNSSILITYGCMSYFHSIVKLGIPYDRDEYKQVRNSTWKNLPLRTFKYKVFKKLVSIDKNLNCFRDNKGNIFRMPADMALLFPLMELVGYDNVKFIDTPTYKYRLHPNNDQFRNREEQYASEVQVRSKSSFNRFF